MKHLRMNIATILVVAIAAEALAQGTIAPAEPRPSTTVAGKYDAITDVPGIEVGSYERNYTGTTVVLVRKGAVGGVDVRGSAPGTRETDLLDPINLVNKVDAVILTGGSAYGLAAADGVMLWLEEHKIGWPVGGGNVVPIVPTAVLYDPGRFGRAFSDRPTAEFGRKAVDAAKGGPVKMGNVGAGAGAIAGGLKGGLGTASVDLGNGVIVGAIVAVNAGGSTVNPATGEFYARYLEVGGEFGKLKPPFASLAKPYGTVAELPAYEPAKNTTIAVVATNVQLSKAEAKKVAEMAHDGMGRAIQPAHTMFDGDTIFALATGELDPAVLRQSSAWGNAAANVTKVGAAAADALARAIVRAMLSAESAGEVPSYRDKYPTAF
jgi:L-aminopeptidase/D-esterase-like protein